MLFTSELANQNVQRALFTCVIYTKEEEEVQLILKRMNYFAPIERLTYSFSGTYAEQLKWLK